MVACNARSVLFHGHLIFSSSLWLTNNRSVGHRANRRSLVVLYPPLVANVPSFSRRRLPATAAAALRGGSARHRVGRRCSLVPSENNVASLWAPGAHSRRCTIHFTSCRCAPEIRNQSSACALALSGSGGCREDAQAYPLFAFRWNGTGDAHGRRCRLFDDIGFFPVLVVLGPAAATDVKATIAKSTGSSSTDGASNPGIGSKCIETNKRSLRASRRSEQRPEPAVRYLFLRTGETTRPGMPTQPSGSHELAIIPFAPAPISVR
jgi:hypothetical protein